GRLPAPYLAETFRGKIAALITAAKQHIRNLVRISAPARRLSRNPLGVTDTVKCSGADAAFAGDGPAVAVWEPGRRLIRPSQWIDLFGPPQSSPDRNTRGYLDSRGDRHWLDVFADISGQRRASPPAIILVWPTTRSSPPAFGRSSRTSQASPNSGCSEAWHS